MKIGAYFYPQTTINSERYSIYGENQKLVPEMSLVRFLSKQNKKYNKYRQYVIPHNGEFISEWDDYNFDVVESQMRLLKEFGVDYVICDTYIGSIDGENKSHLLTSCNNVMLAASGNQLKHCNMYCLRGARSHIPVVEKSEKVIDNRNFDLNLLTAELIVKHCVSQLESKEYLRIDGKPVVYVLITQNIKWSNQLIQNKVRFFYKNLQEIFIERYGSIPFIVGVYHNHDSFELYNSISYIDALSHYAYLPQFDKLFEYPLQDYSEYLNRSLKRLEYEYGLSINPIFPSATIGWDCTPRTLADHNTILNNPKYPDCPIVINGDVKKFKYALNLLKNLVVKNNKSSKRCINIFAFNEIGESASFLPYLENNRVNMEYLNSIKSFSDEVE